MPELVSHVKLKLTGEMTCRFQQLELVITAASLKVLFEEERQPYHLELHLAFAQAAQVEQLAAAFPGLLGLHRTPPFDFGFSMKPEVIARHAQAFSDVDELEKWITVAGGACFELANYDYIGRVEQI